MANSFKGFVKRGTELCPITVVINEAKASGTDYYCEVRITGLLSGPKRIFGADAEQSWSLAVGFVRSILADVRICDKDSKHVDASKLFHDIGQGD